MRQNAGLHNLETGCEMICIPKVTTCNEFVWKWVANVMTAAKGWNPVFGSSCILGELPSSGGSGVF